MPTCDACQSPFPNHMKIDGIKRTLNHRRFCLECSPFGKHNTRRILPLLQLDERRCSCGQTDPSKFYGRKRYICGKCHNAVAMKKGIENREHAIATLGGKCLICEFDRYHSALHVHHLNPSIKDSHFREMRSWSRSRLDAEIKNCVLLCANCHAAHHNEGLELPLGVA